MLLLYNYLYFKIHPRPTCGASRTHIFEEKYFILCTYRVEDTVVYFSSVFFFFLLRGYRTSCLVLYYVVRYTIEKYLEWNNNLENSFNKSYKYRGGVQIKCVLCKYFIVYLTSDTNKQKKKKTTNNFLF